MPTQTIATKTVADNKTLVWLRAGFKHSFRWKRWHTVISEIDATKVCPLEDIHAVILGHHEDITIWIDTLEELKRIGKFLLFVPESHFLSLNASGFLYANTFVFEKMQSRFPFLPEEICALTSISKVVVSIAHILGMNRIAWCLEAKEHPWLDIMKWASNCCISGSPNILHLIPEQTDSVIPKTWLLQQYYIDKNPTRAAEISKCLQKNIENEYIDIILLLNEKEYDLPSNPKLQTKIIGSRLLFSDVFKIIKNNIPCGDFVIFANSDIYCNDTLKHLWELRLNETRLFLALLRWEEGPPLELYKPGLEGASQDVWILSSSQVDFEINSEFNFPFGKPCCDNRIAYMMWDRGFAVVNAAKTIKTIHVHKSNIRNYKIGDNLKGQLLYLLTTGIQNFHSNEKKTLLSPGSSLNNSFKNKQNFKQYTRKIEYSNVFDAMYYCNLLRVSKIANFYHNMNNECNPTQIVLHQIKNGLFLHKNGLLSNFYEIFPFGDKSSQSLQENFKLNPFEIYHHAPSVLAIPYKSEWEKHYGNWFLYYLPLALMVCKSAEENGLPLPYFFYPKNESVENLLKRICCGTPFNIMPYKNATFYTDIAYFLPPNTNTDFLSIETIAILRGILPSAPIFSSKKVVVFCAQIDINATCTYGWAETIATTFFNDDWDIRYVSNEDSIDAYRHAFADASLLIGGGRALDYLWMAGSGATVLEIVHEIAPRENHISLAGACEIKYILGLIKKGGDVFAQRKKTLKDVKYMLQNSVFSSYFDFPVLPKVILPFGNALKDRWNHVGDTFREMVVLWEQLGLIEIEYSESTPYVWWGGIGEILLYDRPTLSWWDSIPKPSYKLALFGNCAPPGPMEELNKQSIWCFWARRPKMLEDIVKSGKPLRGYEQRCIKSLFIGKVENPTQGAKRTNIDWSKSVELFSMPVEVSSKPYPFTQEQYLEKLCDARYGLCLPGFGKKCNREIEYLGCGVVPIVTPDVDIENYLVPLVENIHYLRASNPEEVVYLVENTPQEKWNGMSAACRLWWEENASAHGLFHLTANHIQKFLSQV